MVIKKDIDKRKQTKRTKEVRRQLQRQNARQILVQPVINEMGQNENALGLINNGNIWNHHLCEVNSYLMILTLLFLPLMIINSFHVLANYFHKGEMFGFWSSLSNLDKMLLKDSIAYILINCAFPTLIYVKNEKLRRHVRDEFF